MVRGLQPNASWFDIVHGDRGGGVGVRNNLRCFNAGPASVTLVQHWTNVSWTSLFDGRSARRGLFALNWPFYYYLLVLQFSWDLGRGGGGRWKTNWPTKIANWWLFIRSTIWQFYSKQFSNWLRKSVIYMCELHIYICIYRMSQCLSIWIYSAYSTCSKVSAKHNAHTLSADCVYKLVKLHLSEMVRLWFSQNKSPAIIDIKTHRQQPKYIANIVS